MIEDATNQVSYQGNGSTVTAYPISFRFDDPSWLKVVLDAESSAAQTLALGTDYTLAGTGSLATGTLTTTTAYASTHTLTIYREAPGLQSLSLQPNTPLPASSVETILDRLAMAAEDSVKPSVFASLSALVGRLIFNTWSTITGKPSTSPPSTHGHEISEVTGLEEALENATGAVSSVAGKTGAVTLVSEDITDATETYTNGENKLVRRDVTGALSGHALVLPNVRWNGNTFSCYNSAQGMMGPWGNLSLQTVTANISTNFVFIPGTVAVAPTFANDSAAATGGLAVGDLYFTGTKFRVRTV